MDQSSAEIGVLSHQLREGAGRGERGHGDHSETHAPGAYPRGRTGSKDGEWTQDDTSSYQEGPEPGEDGQGLRDQAE